MDFILTLHSHLPYVLNHGRWPHGSDWLCEAALDTYLPLVEQLRALQTERQAAPVTIGITPVLANQLAHPTFVAEFDRFLEQRLAACAEAPASLEKTRDLALLPLVDYWRGRLLRLQALWRSLDGDLVRTFRRFQDEGSLEIIGSAATHGYLPLLARPESIALQLRTGQAEHRRLFGRGAAGCWLPECAYRPGVEAHLADAGFRYFFTDAHLARAGAPLGAYPDVPLGVERFDVERGSGPEPAPIAAVRSPNRAYQVRAAAPTVATLVRDPASSLQVWSRHQGYPGDAAYLEFHKIRWPGGLKLWRVTGPDVDLGAKTAYDPATAQERAREHARHFAHLIGGFAAKDGAPGAVVVAPFDTELFGHWWFEGVDFIAALYRELRHQPQVRAVSAWRHLEDHPPELGVRLAEGSWGVNGDHTMWRNDQTAWTWKRLGPLEHRFWSVAPKALASNDARPVLAQAARELLLAQASDWQFMISTGAVPDYAEQRFNLHCADAEALVAALEAGAAAGALASARALQARDDVFPDVLDAVTGALGSRAATLAPA